MLACLLTHSLTPWSRVLLEKLKYTRWFKYEWDKVWLVCTQIVPFIFEAPCTKLLKKFPAFYGTWGFITVFTRARHLSLSWARLIQSIPPHPTSLRSILILSSHLHLGLPSGLLLSGFPTKALYATQLSPIHATCPAHLSLRDLITQMIFGEEYRAQSSLLCSLLHSPVTLSLLGPNILLSTLFSKTLSLHSSLNVSNQVSDPSKTTFLDTKLEDKRFCSEW
jgi:hypothetical protein